MAKLARERATSPSEAKSGVVAELRRVGNATRDLNNVIHQRVRLGIVSALAAEGGLTFSDLKRLLSLTDGNLTVHLRKLEDAGYVTCKKLFRGRVPMTRYRLNTAGRKALEEYLEHMDALIGAARQSE